MKTEIEFQLFDCFAPGTIAALLKDAYRFDPRYERDFYAAWEDSDRFFDTHPQIARQCGFVTVLEQKPIGFLCWDNRKMPELVELGHNCIISEFQGRGYGKAQLLEGINRLQRLHVKKITVITNRQLIAAQKNYENVGFRLTGSRRADHLPEYARELMEYVLIL